MKKLCTIPLFVLTGCMAGTVMPECFYTSGLTVCSQVEIDPAEIDTVVSVVEKRINEVYPMSNFVRFLEGTDTKAYFTQNGYLLVNCERVNDIIWRCEKSAAGYNQYQLWNKKYVIEVIWRGGCLARSALSHELMHSAEVQLFGSMVGDHEAPGMFQINARRNGTNEVDTIEHRAKKELYSILPSCQ